MDPENEDRLQKAIEELTRNKTIIMIAHRLKNVRNADQILVVNEGRIIQQGKHEELIGQKGIYYNKQMQKGLLCFLRRSIIRSCFLTMTQAGA